MAIENRTLKTIRKELDEARNWFTYLAMTNQPHRREYFKLVRLEKEYEEFQE